jgi:hypothetical protein
MEKDKYEEWKFFPINDLPEVIFCSTRDIVEGGSLSEFV